MFSIKHYFNNSNYSYELNAYNDESQKIEDELDNKKKNQDKKDNQRLKIYQKIKNLVLIDYV